MQKYKTVYLKEENGNLTALYTVEESIDYKELLIKYIKHIENLCDENYINRINSQNIDTGSLFTNEEISELNKLSEIELTGNTIE